MNRPPRLADTLLRVADGVPDLAQRAAAVGARLAALPHEDAARGLDGVVRAAFGGVAAARDAALACALWSLDPARDELVDRLRLAARDHALDAARRWLTAGPAPRALAAGARLPDVGLGDGLAPSALAAMLGARHLVRCGGEAWMVRRGPAAVARERERLLRHPDDGFVARLLAAPALALDDVVWMAARRPARATHLVAIARSPRWLAHAPVREALAANPYAPAFVARRLAPTICGEAARAAWAPQGW